MKRAAEICNGLVDIIGYLGVEFDEDGNSKRWMYTRETPTLFAGSRFKYLAPKIPFGYDSLVESISKAIEDSERIDGVKVVDRAEVKVVEKALTYDELRSEAKDLWVKLTTSGSEEDNHDMANRITSRIETIFGRPMKLSEITENQVDLYELVVIEMRDLVKNYIK